MSQQLIDHSPDLKQLRDEGYEVEVKGGYLLTHHIPYVNSQKEIKLGVMVTELNLVNDLSTATPNDHVMKFIGEHPCNKDGSIIAGIKHTSGDNSIGNGITTNHSFSNKPPTGYSNYYLKVSRYADIISAPAKSLDNTVTEKTFKIIQDEDVETVFHYRDTNSSRANVSAINAKFMGMKIAIIGLGGTGSFILDLVAKTPVQEIHLFDADDFLQHNAFRAPGAASHEQLGIRMKKANYFTKVYSNMHKAVIPHVCFVNEENVDELGQMNFVFICVDKNSARKTIMGHLLNMKIPFIDVGMGVTVVDDSLIGTIRVTTATDSKNNHLSSRISSVDIDNEEYSTNIQIADLNSLNACLAVIKWKKICGFYQDLEKENHCTYSLNVAQLLNEDLTTPIC